MDNTSRQEQILQLLSSAKSPLTGLSLAEKFGVTRQVIVKDIAIIKAKGADVISTPKGYILPRKKTFSRKINVCHGFDDIEKELQIIVDLGAAAVDTFIAHPFYGDICQKLNIKNRKDIKAFLSKTENENAAPLLELTKGKHSHTIEASDEQTLDEIEEELRNAGFLDV